MRDRFITHTALADLGLEHGFGMRGATPPQGCARAVQVHGCAVARVDAAGGVIPAQADALLSADPAYAAAVVTADCVPILAGLEDGTRVVAIHAGWRGLAAGVVEAGIAALRGAAPGGARVHAVVGPHIGACCYEVDAPVLDALAARYPEAAPAATQPTRPGHARIALGSVVVAALADTGIDRVEVAVPGGCTSCDDRFESYRRDGAGAGRMVHFVRPR